MLRDVGRFENLGAGVRVVKGGHNTFTPLVKIRSTDLPKSVGAMTPRAPRRTPLLPLIHPSHDRV